MKDKIQLMKDVLDGLLEEVEEVSEQIKTKGFVPREICELCRVKDKRAIVEFSPKERKILNKFREWLNERNVIGIERRRFDVEIFFKTSKKLKRAQPDYETEDGYVYSSARQPGRRFYAPVRDLFPKFDEIETCPHFDKHEANLLKIRFYRMDVPSKLMRGGITGGKRIMHKLFLCCDDCKRHVENTMCDRVRKRGFLFDYDCPIDDIVLRKRLSQNGLIYEDLNEREEDMSHEPLEIHFRYIEPLSSGYYLKSESIVISNSERLLRDVVKYLKPKLIVAVCDHANLPSYLELETNILFYDVDGFFFYDKNRQPEKDTQRICDKIVDVLNLYIERERGKEHDRIVSALSSIGEELGFVPQREYNKGSGVRIDCVWFDRDGNIQVALEVETSSTWKKDLISTWEVEPKLAIIVGHAKSDKVATNLMKVSLMKSIPHLVLYVNKLTEHAFLFDKQEMVKNYKLRQKEENKRKGIKNI